METIFMNTEHRKTNESKRFKLELTDKLNLKNSNKNMALANLCIGVFFHLEKHKVTIQQ